MEDREAPESRSRRKPALTELVLLRFLDEYRRDLMALAEYRRLWIVGLRALVEFFGGTVGRIVFLDRASGEPQVHRWTTESKLGFESVPLATCVAYIRQENPRLGENCLVAPFHRDERIHGLVLVERAEEFPRRLREPFRRALALLKEESQRREALRLHSLKEKLSRKLFRKLSPKDFFYQLFHGLRSLLRYDHSATLFVADAHGARFEIAAEQISWKKGKSEAVTQSVPLSPATCEHLLNTRRAILLSEGQLRGDGHDVDALHRDLRALVAGGVAGDAPPVSSALVAPLAYEGTLPGVLRVAGLHPLTLGTEQAGLLDSFLPIASAALGNLLLDQRMRDRSRVLERETAVAELARGVAHDVNNALGVMIPLLEQCRVDLTAEAADKAVLVEDLKEAERYARYCRKIFDGVMRSARRGRARPQPVDVNAALTETLELLAEDLKNRGIVLTTELTPTRLSLHLAPGALDQVLVNLITNARDATPRGGRITVRTRCNQDETILLEVADTGHGIPPEDLGRVAEPFFSTKPGGNGLGLSVVRSIAWDHDGDLQIESELGRGTRVRVAFPLRRAGDADGAGDAEGAGEPGPRTGSAPEVES